ncbi:MAG: T9SS type A sorting domain-containing protein [Bacteroidia bacterium]
MRKVISTLMSFLIVGAVFAQTPKDLKKTQTPGFKRDLDFITNQDAKPMLRKKDEIVVNDWYRFVDDWRALMGGFNSANSFFSIFPDTFVKNLSLDENTNTASTAWQGWHSIGTMFDANDDNWSDPDIAGLRDWHPYTIDSVFFTYGYFRYTGADIVDTLIVQVYNESQVTDGSFNNTGSVFGVVGYDQDQGIGANYSQMIKVPLTELDSNALTAEGTFFAKNLAVALDEPLVVPGNGACAVTITYKPGKDWAFGDTLFYDEDLAGFGVEAPKNRFNRFGLLAAVQTPIYSPLASQNNGLFVVRWNRYDDPFTGGSSFMNDKYYPNNFGGGGVSFGYYPYIAFKVNADYDTGLEDLDGNSNGLGNVFPNPASINDQMTLSFAVNAQERIAINVFDLTGKKVETITNAVYEKGEHTVNFSSQNLKPGMYIYTMTAGEFSTSKKFNVTK